MGTEALAGTRTSFDPFINCVARPHPGQVCTSCPSTCIFNFNTLNNRLRPQRTSGTCWKVARSQSATKWRSQSKKTKAIFARIVTHSGPHLSSSVLKLKIWFSPSRPSRLSAIPVSWSLFGTKQLSYGFPLATDNPLVDGETGVVHHGGNFQAMAVTNAMEKTRLSLHHLGKLLFAQCAELIDPAMNRGLPPSLAATDPSLDYHAKGIDIASAAYVAELGYLANPVSTHIQSAEMHNQAVKCVLRPTSWCPNADLCNSSLALISARQTLTSLEVLSILISSYLYVICQGLSCYSFPPTSFSEFKYTALDLRALQHEFYEGLRTIVSEEFSTAFGPFLSKDASKSMSAQVSSVMHETFDATSTMDAKERMQKVAASTTTTLLDSFTGPLFSDPSLVGSALTAIPTFRSHVAERLTSLLDELRRDYLSGSRGKAPASKYLNKTRPIYEFVRVTLGIRMHGSENYHKFSNGLGVEDVTVGQNVSLIHEVRFFLFFARGFRSIYLHHRLSVTANSNLLSSTCSHPWHDWIVPVSPCLRRIHHIIIYPHNPNSKNSIAFNIISNVFLLHFIFTCSHFSHNMLFITSNPWSQWHQLRYLFRVSSKSLVYKMCR